MIKKILSFLRVWDGLWSVPLSLTAFLVVSVLGRFVFGDAWAAYDPATFQAALLASAIMIFTNTVVQLAIKFNFPVLWNMYHTSFAQTFYELKPWQKIFYTVFTYCFFFVSLILLFLKLV